MSTYSKEMLEAINGLGKTDLEDSSTDAIVKLILASQSGLATKTDIDLLRKEFKTDSLDLRAGIERFPRDSKPRDVMVDALASKEDSKVLWPWYQMLFWIVFASVLSALFFEGLERIFLH